MSRIEASLISTRTMFLLTEAGSATRRMRQSYALSSAVSSEPAAPSDSAMSAATAPSERPATTLRSMALILKEPRRNEARKIAGWRVDAGRRVPVNPQERRNDEAHQRVFHSIIQMLPVLSPR
jgi:hypothetical protein